MIVSVNVTLIGAAAADNHLPRQRLFAAWLTPSRESTEGAYGRPVRHCRWQPAIVEACEISDTIDDLASDHRQQRGRVGDLVLPAREEIPVRHDKIRQLAGLDPALLAFFVGKPSDVFRPHPQRGLPIKAITLRVKLHTADGPAG